MSGRNIASKRHAVSDMTGVPSLSDEMTNRSPNAMAGAHVLRKKERKQHWSLNFKVLKQRRIQQLER